MDTLILKNDARTSTNTEMNTPQPEWGSIVTSKLETHESEVGPGILLQNNEPMSL